MKAHLFLIGLVIILFLNSCTGGGPNIVNQYGYNVEIIAEGTLKHGTGYTTFLYKDYNTLLADKKKELANKLASEKDAEKELLAIPRGGIATIEIARTTIDAANTNMFEYVIFENGKEIYRKHGKNSVPNAPHTGDGIHWWNVDLITFPKPITNQMTVYVVDNLHQIRAKYIITKTKK